MVIRNRIRKIEWKQTFAKKAAENEIFYYTSAFLDFKMFSKLGTKFHLNFFTLEVI